MKKALRVIIVGIIISAVVWFFYNLEPISKLPTLGFSVPKLPLAFLWLGIIIVPIVVCTTKEKGANRKQGPMYYDLKEDEDE